MKQKASLDSTHLHSNFQWENIKISVTFQREVINHVIPEVQPDLIHCHDWMTGLIPALAKKFEIPCLFTVQNPDATKNFPSYVEDLGIDAAAFWQHLFYDRYPINYEETRETNPANFLLIRSTNPMLLTSVRRLAL
jgi:glycogen synthase